MPRNPAHLARRFGGESSAKIRDLAERSASGSMSGFQGIFQVEPIDEAAVQDLAATLAPYLPNKSTSHQSDSAQLMQLLLEVKAISHQALLLHGERIKAAQNILREYREGAFTLWLQRAYSNRQTPYNLLQYFEFFQVLPAAYRPRVEQLPRHIVYQLASRREPLKKKLAVLDLLDAHTPRDYGPLLRRELPLPLGDQRRKQRSEVYRSLARAHHLLSADLANLDIRETRDARALLGEIDRLLAVRAEEHFHAGAAHISAPPSSPK